MNSPDTVDRSFAVGGMTCASCVRFVEKALLKVPGVDFVSVNLSDGKAYAVTDGTPRWPDLADAVKKAGYEPLEEVPDEDAVEQEFRLAGRRILAAWAVALPAMTLMILHMTGVHIPYMSLLEAIAGLGVLLGPGRKILKGAWIALSHRHANMDVLVSLGTIAAWATAVLAMADLPLRSFGALAPMLPAFHLTGRYVEARLKRRAGADLRALMAMDGGTASVIDEGGTIRNISVEAVKEGMLLRVRTGERIPLDGKIISGSGAVSEAMVTGEPLPAAKAPGDEVIGGTVLENGVLEIEVTRVGKDAFLARMITLVEQAQGVQVPLQALADKVAGIFVPVVFGLSLLMFAVWAIFYPSMAPMLERFSAILPWVPAGAGQWTTAVFAMVSMLVVACPCALGLATPMALSVGSGLAARRGLLIKGGEALQIAGNLDLLLFDKTGTLTMGHPAVTSASISRRDAAAAAALEELSVHPLARAVVQWAAADMPDTVLPVPDNVREIAGEGIEGRIDGVQYFVGRPATPAGEVEAGEVEAGETVIEVRRDGEAVGHFSLSDPVKSDASAAVRALMKRGVRPVMITGDAAGAARTVAAAVGIPESDVRAGLHPEDKLRAVQEFRQKGFQVGMIGDGINDAAALKAADVGFALAEGTDLSMEAGDIVITRGGLGRILEAMNISSLIVRTIKGNLFWAFVYNIIALPAAAVALVHPLIAETAMSLSSVGVVLNSLRINRRFRRRNKEIMMNTYEIEVTGMSCGHCVSRVESALEPISGKVTVNLEANLATVESDRPLDDLLTALTEAGYPGKLRV